MDTYQDFGVNLRRMASPPKPYEGYNETEAGTDFGVIRTFDGHIATDRFGIDDGRSHRNARKGWDEQDISQYPEDA